MNYISVKTKNHRFPIAEELYGLFFEEINRSGDGGLYPEMLRNRSFEDSILPKRCTVLKNGFGFQTPEGWRDQFNNGEGLQRWRTDEADTSIPAWYAESAEMELDYKEVLNEHRKAALRVKFQKNGTIYNVGFKGIPVSKEASYPFYMFAKAEGKESEVVVSLASKDGQKYDSQRITIAAGDYQKYEMVLSAQQEDFKAILLLECLQEAEIVFGFMSLMPGETYKNHGLRKDLMELLDGLNGKFLRFPGGCVVEGFTKETAARFVDSIGPVWERPSHTIMWHYRMTNGLGFHEYLQMCEDLNVAPMYVINCGMTCQGRNTELFEGEELKEFIQDACNAIDYATADSTNNKWAAMRAKAGHPEPFSLKYVEIGNENDHEPYFERYALFYKTLKKRYPQINFIANTHTEQQGLPTEIVDEHYYNSADYFAKNVDFYDKYDRKGPEIFVGEYAVTCGADISNLRAALAEAAFLIGLENNQDIVKLSCYAPLFSHVGYKAWHPDLIEFDNHTSYGIPTYYALSMLGANRGKNVLEVEKQLPRMTDRKLGRCGLVTNAVGVQMKNLTMNGKPISVSHTMAGHMIVKDDVLESGVSENNFMENFPGFAHSLKGITFVTFGEEDVEQFVYEGEIKIDNPEQKVDLTIWNYNSPMLAKIDETIEDSGEWAPDTVDYCAWSIKDSVGAVNSVHWFYDQSLGDNVDLNILYGEFWKFKIVSRPDGFDCYINDILVQKANFAPYKTMAVVATDDDEHIIVKAVNLAGKDTDIQLKMDCEVESEYLIDILESSDYRDINTLDNPRKVVSNKLKKTGASSNFIHTFPAFSLNVLTFQKK